MTEAFQSSLKSTWDSASSALGSRVREELSSANDRLAELEARLASSSAGEGRPQEAAQLTQRIQELEAENEEMFSRMSEMEEAADEQLGKLHAAQNKLAATEELLHKAGARSTEAPSAQDDKAIEVPCTCSFLGRLNRKCLFLAVCDRLRSMQTSSA